MSPYYDNLSDIANDIHNNIGNINNFHADKSCLIK